MQSLCSVDKKEQHLLACLGEEWYQLLSDEFKKQYMKDLMGFVAQRRKDGTVYPPRGEVFTAYKLTPYNSVRVCIVGQDPYINPFEAHGLAFSTWNSAYTPSLRQIEQAVRRDVYPNTVAYNWSNNLKRWALQGVMLINRVLTVDAGKSRSHANQGWESFTRETVKILDKKGIIFLLWGADAKALKPFITNSTVIECEHPQAANWDGRQWNNNGCFKKTNQILQEPILW